MNSVTTIGSWLALGVGICAIAVTVYIYLRSSVDKGTITSLEQRVAAQDGLIETIKDQNEFDSKRKDAKIQAQSDQINDLKLQVTSLGRELSIWRNAVTAKEEIGHLQTTLEDHHLQTLQVLTAIRDEVTR